MAEVKWIKIVTDIFDDEKVLLIENMPEADSIIVIWFKLLCMAGKQNNNGVFMMNDKIPYTDEMLATIFRRPLNTVRLALSIFEKYGMIEIVNNVYTITNWEKHQSLDALQKQKEQNRLRVAAYRDRKRAELQECNANSNVTVTKCNGIDKDIEKEREKEIITFTYKERVRACEEVKNLDFQTKKALNRIAENENLTDKEFDIILKGLKNAIQLGCFTPADFSFLASRLEDNVDILREHIAKGERNARLIERVIKEYAPR